MLAAIKEGTPISKELAWTGEGEELTIKRLFELRDQLCAIQDLAKKKGPLQMTFFDKECAVALHKALHLTRREAVSEPRFWELLTIEVCPMLVTWRYEVDSLVNVSRERVMGGFQRNMFQRLWMRGEIAHDEGREDPYELVRCGGEQFWVDVLDREVSGSNRFVQLLIQRTLVDHEENTTVTGEAIKHLREVYVSRPFDLLPDAELDGLIAEAVHRALKATAKSARGSA